MSLKYGLTIAGGLFGAYVLANDADAAQGKSITFGGAAPVKAAGPSAAKPSKKIGALELALGQLSLRVDTVDQNVDALTGKVGVLDGKVNDYGVRIEGLDKTNQNQNEALRLVTEWSSRVDSALGTLQQSLPTTDHGRYAQGLLREATEEVTRPAYDAGLSVEEICKTAIVRASLFTTEYDPSGLGSAASAIEGNTALSTFDRFKAVKELLLKGNLGEDGEKGYAKSRLADGLAAIYAQLDTEVDSNESIPAEQKEARKQELRAAASNTYETSLRALSSIMQGCEDQQVFAASKRQQTVNDMVTGMTKEGRTSETGNLFDITALAGTQYWSGAGSALFGGKLAINFAENDSASVFLEGAHLASGTGSYTLNSVDGPVEIVPAGPFNYHQTLSTAIAGGLNPQWSAALGAGYTVLPGKGLNLTLGVKALLMGGDNVVETTQTSNTQLFNGETALGDVRSVSGTERTNEGFFALGAAAHLQLRSPVGLEVDATLGIVIPTDGIRGLPLVLGLTLGYDLTALPESFR